jgi:serine/threonine protein kinase
MSSGDAEQFATKTTGRDELLAKLGIFDQMCAAVSAANRLGCLHRDLKFGNFLVHRGKVKLGDFGTARLSTLPPLLQHYALPVGDLRYTAPELLAGLDPDGTKYHAADAYSMGAIFFELLTGQQLSAAIFGMIINVRAFMFQLQQVPQQNRTQVFQGLLAGWSSRLPDIRTVNPDLPRCAYPFLQRILTGLTQVDPLKRELRLDEIRRLVRICRIVLENERQYLAMLERRRARKKGRNT